MKLLIFVVLIATLFCVSFAGKTRRPFTLKTQMKVKDSDPKNTKFIQVSTRKDGKPVGIIVKRRSKASKTNKRKPKELSEEISEEVQEIIGVRVPDDSHDLHNIYRNAKIINNKLVPAESFRFHEGE